MGGVEGKVLCKMAAVTMEARPGAITHETLRLTAVDFHRFKFSVSGVVLSSQGDAWISSAVRLVTNAIRGP